MRSPAITTYLTRLTMSRSPSFPFSHRMNLWKSSSRNILLPMCRSESKTV